MSKAGASPAAVGARAASRLRQIFLRSDFETQTFRKRASEAETVRQQPVKLWLRTRAWGFESLLMHREGAYVKGKQADSKPVILGSNPGAPAIRGRLGMGRPSSLENCRSPSGFCGFDSRTFRQKGFWVLGFRCWVLFAGKQIPSTQNPAPKTLLSGGVAQKVVQRCAKPPGARAPLCVRLAPPPL